MKDLVAVAAEMKGLEVKGLPKEHPDLHGAHARLDDDMIYFNMEVEDWIAVYNQVHEIGHVVLGHGERECVAEDLNTEASETKIPFGVHRVEGYGPQERIECEANVFAREFLLPRDVLRRWFIEEKLNAAEIAKRTGMGIEMVSHQLAFALLTPEIPEDLNIANEETELKLNPSQEDAAYIKTGPQLIDAGPGTGKTRTLVGRVLYLLNKGIAPDNILVLTFSNKAVEELRSRLHQFAPDSAAALTIETFHSFGLELLRKYGTAIGLEEKPELIDPVDAVLLLERALPDLQLDYYQYLREPSRNLPDIARAISRAKDENVGPAGYFDLATKQREAAAGEDEIQIAEKAIEVARVYKKYEELLTEQKVIDLGDLICKSIEVLSKHENIRTAVREQYEHVLVDEYQDVNRASGLLLKEIVREGQNLWAVGDLRQSIHRWRGATTANIRLFKEDFPLAGETISLAKNYRSKPGIVELFASFAPQMRAAQGTEFKAWETHHEVNGVAVRFETAADPESEALGIAGEISKLHDDDVSFRDQAVICRTHTAMARVARVLIEKEIPVLYMGDFFERPEVRDLLALLSLAAGPDGSGLVRVARFPEYNIGIDDIMTFIAACSQKDIPFPAALSNSDHIDGISEEGRAKLKLIASHLDDLTHGRSAWKCLTRYLFERSKYLDRFLADASVLGQQRRLAIYQLLRFVHSRLDPAAETEGDSDPKRELIRYIRRLEIYGDEKQLREPDEWASAIDAVRIMTIHASKGLEFRAVFIPGMSKGNIPFSGNSKDICPPPHGLISETNQDWRLEEEECLFFVAMSRAREYLFLSRPLRKGGKGSNPSEFLDKIKGVLPSITADEATWKGQFEPEEAAGFTRPQPGDAASYRPSELEVYLKCPLKFFYEFVLGLSGKSEDGAYYRFHRTVRSTVRLLKQKRIDGLEITDEMAAEALDAQWEKEGPSDHYLGDLYKDSAKVMIANAAAQIRASSGKSVVTDHEVRLPNGTIKLSFDFAATQPNETNGVGHVIIQRFRTGRPTKSESDKNIYALLSEAAKEIADGAGSSIEILYLRDGYAEPVEMSTTVIKNRLIKYDGAMKGIADGKFYPITSDRDCPRCSHYFICPAAV